MARDHGGLERIQNAAAARSVAESEVARVLVKERRQDGIAEGMADDVITISSGRALCVSFGSPAEAAIGIIHLADSGHEHRKTEGVWIGGGTELEPKLLRRTEGNGVSVIGHIEGRYDDDRALVFLLLDLLLGLLALGFLAIRLLRILGYAGRGSRPRSIGQSGVRG